MQGPYDAGTRPGRPAQWMAAAAATAISVSWAADAAPLTPTAPTTTPPIEIGTPP